MGSVEEVVTKISLHLQCLFHSESLSPTGTEGHSESESITDHLESLASDIERVRKTKFNQSNYSHTYTHVFQLSSIHVYTSHHMTYSCYVSCRFVVNHQMEIILWKWPLLMTIDK